MIMYEFICKKCREVFEELLRDDSDAISCPQCGSPDVERVLSAVKSKSDGQGGGLGAGSNCAPSSGFS